MESLFFNSKNLVTATLAPMPEPSISFIGADDKPIIRLESNGDIFIHGNLIENDKEVVDGMKSFLAGNESYWKQKYDAQAKELEEYKFKYEQLCK